MRKYIKTALAALCITFITTGSACDDVIQQTARLKSGVTTELVLTPDEYHINDPAPAMALFQIVTSDRGWSQADIDAWSPFAQAVMAREARFCPGVIYGQSADANCNVRGRPKGTAAGFGQILMRVNGSWLCGQEGLCDRWAVVASPYASMTAFVATIERGGRGPWCYTTKLRRGRVCHLAP